MIKKIFLTIGLFLILITVFVIYLSLVGVETTKFNSFIKIVSIFKKYKRFLLN